MGLDARVVKRSGSVAIELRLGNVSLISTLRHTISAVFEPGDSLILNKILYSGSHCGDSVEIVAFPVLRAEINRLRAIGLPEKDVNLRRFVADMESLLEVAEREQSEIVFV